MHEIIDKRSDDRKTVTKHHVINAPEKFCDVCGKKLDKIHKVEPKSNREVILGPHKKYFELCRGCAKDVKSLLASWEVQYD